MSKCNTLERPAVMQGDWIDPLETALREGVHGYLRELLELEVTARRWGVCAMAVRRRPRISATATGDGS